MMKGSDEKITLPEGAVTMFLLEGTANLLDKEGKLYLLDYVTQYYGGIVPKDRLAMWGHLYSYRLILPTNPLWSKMLMYVPPECPKGFKVYINKKLFYSNVEYYDAKRLRMFLLQTHKTENSGIYRGMRSLMFIDPQNKCIEFLWKKHKPMPDKKIKEFIKEFFKELK